LINSLKGSDRMLRKLLPFSLAILLLASCAPAPETDPVASEEGVSQPPVSSVQPEPEITYYQHPLTGEYTLTEEKRNLRPISVMIANNYRALPQKGISQADVIFEALAEGGITRIMPVFYDYANMPEVGPVRSVRDHFLNFAAPMKTLFVHWGGSYIATNMIKDLGLTTLNGMYYSTVGFRTDSTRANKKGLEYSRYTSGKLIQGAINATKSATTLETPLSPIFNFAEKGQTAPDGDLTGTYIRVPFSGGNVSQFTYDADTGLYGKTIYDEPQIDETTGEQVKVTNVLVLFATTEPIAGSKDNLVKLYLNSGSGYYLRNGTASRLIWTMGDYGNSLKLLNSDGTETVVSPGKTWICFLPSSRENDDLLTKK